jgi:hypothetical protein
MTSNKFAAFLFVFFVANSLCLFFILLFMWKNMEYGGKETRTAEAG